MNRSALAAVLVFAGALFAVFAAVYAGAAASHRRGELDASGLRILRWAFLGHVALYAVMASTAWLT